MRKILTIAILLIATQLGYSQSDMNTKFFVKTGANVSTLTENDFTEYDATSGYSIGAGLDIPVFRDWMSVRTELKLIRKGYSLDMDGYTSDITCNLTYVEVPVLYMFKPKISDNCRFTGGVGAYFAAGVGGHMHGTGVKTDSFDDVEEDYDLGLCAAMGFEFNNHWMLNLEVEAGCVELYDTPKIDYNNNYHHHHHDDDLKNTNATVALTIGYKF